MTVNELIKKIILGEVTLSQGLLLAKTMYKNALSEESYAWICHEIDHYKDVAEMPDYRIVDCVVKAVVSGYYIGKRIEELDTTVINRQLAESDLSYGSPNKMLIRQGIESIEQSLDSLDSHVEMELTRGQMDMLLEFYLLPAGCKVERMYQQCRAELIKNIITCVKNRLLSILENEVGMSNSELSEGKGLSKKQVFISYGWDDDEHRKWVKELADRLSEYFDVRIDVKQPLGIELNMFMEQMVTKSDRVLLILSPIYKAKADARINGVGYESVLISSELYKNQGSAKFIPVIRRGTKEESYPLYLGNRKGIWMTENSEFEEKLKELIEDIRNN